MSVMGSSVDARLVPRERAWPMLHVVAAVALSLRLAVAWWSESISHPDHIFQYLEQAHRLVYGYGFVPWEFRFGVRNWLLPGALAALLEALRAVGLDQPTVYIPVLKSVFAALSVSVVYACYAIGRNLFSEDTGRAAAVLVAIWHEMLYHAVLPTPEVLGAYAIVGALALTTGEGRRAIPVGLLLGISVALRLQYAVPAAALWIFVIIFWGWRSALSVAVSGAAVFAFAGMLDAWSWGIPFVSYYNSVAYNILYGVSDIFGRHHPLQYFYWLIRASLGLHAIAGVYGLLVWKRSWPILVTIICVLGPHVFVGHKEYRFVFLAVPLLLVLLAALIVSGLSRLPPGRAKWLVTITVIGFVSTLGGILGGVMKQDGRLLAMLDISRRSDVVAVIDLTDGWWTSGGFYYLHHNVPYYFGTGGRPLTELRLLGSHVISPASKAAPPGFRISARYGDVVVLEQVSPPAAYLPLKDDREPPQPRVDDTFTPTVRPRF